MSQTTPEKITAADQAAAQFLTAEDMLREYVREVELDDLIKRIEKFRALDFKNLSRDEILGNFKSVLKFGAADNKTRPSHICVSRVIPVGPYLYRIRPIDQSKLSIPLPQMLTESDAWEPPPDKVKIDAQRLNQAGEAILYTSPKVSVALEETKVANNDIVPIIIYQIVKPIHLTVIGMPPASHGLSKDEFVKVAMITNFLRDEFTRYVGKEHEFLYKISETLAKKYFSIPDDIHDGWEYPSMAKRGGINVGFKPHRARLKLALRGVIVARAKLIDGNFLFEPHCVAQGFDSSGQFIYHEMGSAASHVLMRDFNRVG
jgi:hypothetical protein